jgi:hypothetical protein
VWGRVSHVNPSRVVAFCFFLVSVLLVAQVGIAGEPQLTAGAVLQVIGGVFLLLASLFGLVRYEQNPIVSEYGATTSLLIAGLVLWTVGLLTQLVTA